MAIDLLTTSGINSLINSYKLTESNKRVTSLTKQKTKYTNVSTAYSTISSKFDSLKNILGELKQTGTDSIFSSKKASSSNASFVTTSANSSASTGSFSIRTEQLAKSDIVVSQDVTSATSNAITGTHSFVIKTGDGSTGEYTSNIDVIFTSGETNKTVMEKIRDAINSDKAEVTSNVKTASSTYSGGASSFNIDFNGTTTTISVNGSGTYEQLVDEIITNITANSNLSGITAEKVSNSPSTGDVKLKLSVSDSSKYISISHASGFDIVSDLNIGVTKHKGASGLVTASVFSPDSTTSQLSFTALNSGLDNRITSLSDSGSYTALSSFGLNLGTTRTAFSQSTNPDTAGFIYSDITSSGNQLNAKFQFNGLSFQRNSNTVSDLVNGTTFNLKSVMALTDTTVVVNSEIDKETIKSKIKGFITNFNEIYSYLKTNTASVDGVRGILIGDSNASAIIQKFAQTAYSNVSGITSGNLSYLTQIGITFDSASGLKVSDESLLDNKLTNYIAQVEDLFNSSNGIANTLYDFVDPYLGSTGYLANSIKLLNDNIEDVSDRITYAQDRIDKSAETLRRQYEQLQTQLAMLMNSQSIFNYGSSGSFF